MLVDLVSDHAQMVGGIAGAGIAQAIGVQHAKRKRLHRRKRDLVLWPPFHHFLFQPQAHFGETGEEKLFVGIWPRYRMQGVVDDLHQGFAEVVLNFGFKLFH